MNEKGAFVVTEDDRHKRPVTVFEWIRWAKEELSELSDPPLREATGLMATLLGSPLRVVTDSQTPLASDLQETFVDRVSRRKRREPFHLITGEVIFSGMSLRLCPGVLIPRPETELLVAEIVSRQSLNPPRRILELGGGSGAIICALLLAFPEATGMAVDIEESPLRCMEENRVRTGLSRRLHLLRGDWDESLSPGGLFDLVVSNPPYIPSREIDHLMEEVRLFEPRRALDGGVDGLDSYRRILNGSPSRRIRAGGLLAVEIGAGQREAFETGGTFYQLAGFNPAEIVTDWSGHGRVVIWKRKE